MIEDIPFGYCHCGCGQKTRLASKTRLERGQVQGEPVSYVKGHNGRLANRPLCSIAECEQEAICRGWCWYHYNRWHITGSTDAPSVFTPEERFWSKVTKTDTCWWWTAGTASHGYGSFNPGHGRSPTVAHRFAYELLIGPIPEGLTLDHLCRNRLCVNPSHLEPVTNAENVRRASVHRYQGGSRGLQERIGQGV